MTILTRRILALVAAGLTTAALTASALIFSSGHAAAHDWPSAAISSR